MHLALFLVPKLHAQLEEAGRRTYAFPVLVEGRIVKTGGRDLALKLEERGYAWIHEELAAGA